MCQYRKGASLSGTDAVNEQCLNGHELVGADTALHGYQHSQCAKHIGGEACFRTQTAGETEYLETGVEHQIVDEEYQHRVDEEQRLVLYLGKRFESVEYACHHFLYLAHEGQLVDPFAQNEQQQDKSSHAHP